MPFGCKSVERGGGETAINSEQEVSSVFDLSCGCGVHIFPTPRPTFVAGGCEGGRFGVQKHLFDLLSGVGECGVYSWKKMGLKFPGRVWMITEYMCGTTLPCTQNRMYRMDGRPVCAGSDDLDDSIREGIYRFFPLIKH